MPLKLELHIHQYQQERAVLAALLTAVAGLVLLLMHVAAISGTLELNYSDLVSFPLSQWLVGLLLVPAVAALHHLPGRSSGSAVATLLIGGCIYCLLLFSFSGLATMLLERLFRLPEHYNPATLIRFISTHWPQSFYYLLLLALQLGMLELLKAKRLIHFLQEKNSHLLSSKQASDLSGLRHRLTPHFLFNSLNNIAMVVRKGQGEAAVESMISLGQVLSKAMDREQQHLVAFSDELALIHHFVAIEKLRDQAVEVCMEVEEGAKRCKVPALFLQPVVENAFKYSAAGGLHSRSVSLKAEVSHGRLKITVFNSGSCLSPVPRNGIGMANTIHRLRHAYGANFSFTCRNSPEGVEVMMEIPASTE